MSWNVAQQLNNLTYQVNDLANSSVANPMEKVLDCAGYDLNNVNVIDGGVNPVVINTDNIGGIQLNGQVWIGDSYLQIQNIQPKDALNVINASVSDANVVVGHFRVDQFNNVGINKLNTDTLSAQLDVNGNGRITGNFIIDGQLSYGSLYPPAPPTIESVSATGSGITATTTDNNVVIQNTGVLSLTGSNGVSVSSSTGNITISGSGVQSLTVSGGIVNNGSATNPALVNSGVLGVGGARAIRSSGGQNPTITAECGYGIINDQNTNLIQPLTYSSYPQYNTANNIANGNPPHNNAFNAGKNAITNNTGYSMNFVSATGDGDLVLQVLFDSTIDVPRNIASFYVFNNNSVNNMWLLFYKVNANGSITNTGGFTQLGRGQYIECIFTGTGSGNQYIINKHSSLTFDAP